MVRCDSCGLEYANPLIAPGADWYGLVYGSLNLYPAKRWEFEFVLNTMSTGETLGELGCGTGEFLRLCQQARVQASGLDFSEQAVDACNRSGLVANVVDLDNETTAFPRLIAPDVVVAFQVLEHLENPRALFSCARQWAASNGRLWIAVPSDRRPSRLLRESDFLDEPPHHMTRWTADALARVAVGTDWHCRRIIYEPIDWSTKLWWISTRSATYRRLNRAGLLRNRWVERAARMTLAPATCLQSAIHSRLTSGQTMLAEYTGTDERISA
jgi:SAM-dependent methyltransferase